MQDINPNLLSKEKLNEIIKEKDKEIETLQKKQNKDDIRNCFYWQIACFFIVIPTIVICTNVTYSLQQKHIVYAYFIIGLIASGYCVYKVVTLNKLIFINKSVGEFNIEEEILLEELSTEELKQKLDVVISEQDYEYASLIRD